MSNSVIGVHPCCYRSSELFAMPPQYAMCKHGPRHRMSGCGFCHDPVNLSFPARIPSQLWRDTTHEHRGHAGLDYFVGQQYTHLQMERVLVYLQNSEFRQLPNWARMLGWFYKVFPADHFPWDGDFGCFDMLDAVVCRCVDPVRDGLPVGFSYALDQDGVCFQRRMRDRMEDAQYFVECQCIQSWSLGDTQLVGMPYGGRTLRTRQGQKYCIIEGIDDMLWVSPAPCSTGVLVEGGWAPQGVFVTTGQAHLLHQVVMPSAVLSPVSVAAPVVVAGEGRCVVFSDGSVSSGDQRFSGGIAAGWIFSGLYASGSASLACTCTGSEAGELLGIGRTHIMIGKCRYYVL